MPRLAGLRPVLLALALLPLPLGACTSHGAADGGAPVVELTPLPAPAGHLGDLVVPAPGATWAKARGVLGSPALFLPQSFGPLVATLVGMPITLSAEIDDAVPVVGAAARQGHGAVQAVIGVHVKAGDRFVDQLTKGEGARFNAAVDPATHVTLLTDKVSPESARLALGVLGNYLLVGQRPADLYAVGPYVVRTLGARDGAAASKDDLSLDLPEQALGGPVLDAVRELRGQSEKGPAATLVPLATMLDNAITLLGDASHARLAVNLDGATLHGRAAVTPKAGGGPGSKLVSDLAVGDVKPLLDLPETTTLGLLWRESTAARAESTPKQADALARLIGHDVTTEDRAAIAAALGAGAEARGDWQTVGVAFNGTGPTAVVRVPVTDAERMKKALKQLVDLGNLASFKRALAGLGIKLVSDKAVVENLAADVTRVRLARTGDEGKEAKPKADKKSSAAEAAKAIDLLYFVDGAGLFAAAGYDPKDSLRALAKAPTGPNLSANAPMASALGAVGGDAAFVLVADVPRIRAMVSGAVPPAAPTPLVVAAGRSSAPVELWGRVDLPASVVQQLVQEAMQRRAAPASP